MDVKRVLLSIFLLGVVGAVSGCVIAPPPPHEWYYDHDHHRYWHDRGWHDCVDNDEHCR